eukprot:m.129580 g.129580  ORF g.129580 m.129580 type:complete len:129 (-) comp23648_c0_seq2:115-501(-)
MCEFRLSYLYYLQSQVTLKGFFKFFLLARLHREGKPGAFSMFAITKEKKGLNIRLKKTKDKGEKSKEVFTSTDNLTNVICRADRSKHPLRVSIDGVVWSDVKFFSISPQWPTHIKQFPIALLSQSNNV